MWWGIRHYLANPLVALKIFWKLHPYFIGLMHNCNYFFHEIEGIESEMYPDSMRVCVGREKEKKKRKKGCFFFFTCHKNMWKCLLHLSANKTSTSTNNCLPNTPYQNQISAESKSPLTHCETFWPTPIISVRWKWNDECNWDLLSDLSSFMSFH